MTKFIGNISKDAHKSPAIVSQYLQSMRIPIPEFEYVFCPPRKWRMDMAWVDYKVYLEVQGGIWPTWVTTKDGKRFKSIGRHLHGEALLEEWQKINTASILGFRPIFCQPIDFFTDQTMEYIRKALGLFYK